MASASSRYFNHRETSQVSALSVITTTVKAVAVVGDRSFVLPSHPFPVGFVNYDKPESGQRAIQELNGYAFGN